jgi:3-hydroxymyristoyl/3-hydroxydecanoyl-(acyl carrier protein) dehydratase
MSIDKWKRRSRRKPVFVESDTTEQVTLGREDLERMLPHRDPFLLVDAIDRVDLTAQSIRGTAYIDPELPVLAGHFPDYPVYPGVYQMEMIGQISICLYHLLKHNRSHTLPDDTPPNLRLTKLHHAMFLAEVKPGDTIHLTSHLLEQDSYTVTCVGQVLKGDTICASAIMEVFLMDEDDTNE